MTAIEIREPGPPQVLRAVRRPLPQPKAGEVLIRVAAAGVNRPDVLQRKGLYPAPPGASDIPGLEVAGVVVALGEGVTDPALGARVCALLAGGGYAEYTTAPAVQCLPAPSQLALEEAAALPETFFTVWFNVFERARLRSGETLLVHGGSSGIGTSAILLGKAFGARLIVTAGTAAKCAACRELGADHAINYHEQDFVEATLRATDGRGADVILDMVGGDYVARNIAAAATNARIAVIAHQGGARSAPAHGEAVADQRLDAAGAVGREQGAPRGGAAPTRLAAVRHQAPEAAHPRALPTRRCGRGSQAHGVRRPHRQDRARRLKA
jgi:NADPH2:quinone reductase